MKKKQGTDPLSGLFLASFLCGLNHCIQQLQFPACGAVQRLDPSGHDGGVNIGDPFGQIFPTFRGLGIMDDQIDRWQASDDGHLPCIFAEFYSPRSAVMPVRGDFPARESPEGSGGEKYRRERKGFPPVCLKPEKNSKI